MATEHVESVQGRAGRTTDHPSKMRPNRRDPLPLPAAISARVVVAGLAGVMAWIHLHLWSTGYRHIHIIGPLFLVNGVVGIVLAVGILGVPSRLLSPLAAVTSLFTAGTLLGLIVSINVGLFGWKEFLGPSIVTETLVVEPLGVLLSALLAVIYARTALAGWNRRQHAP